MKKLILLFLFTPYILLGQNEFIGSIERLTPEMDNFISKDSKIEIIAKGFSWSEGPVWSKKLNALLFSDVPNNVIYKWDEKNGLDVFIDKTIESILNQTYQDIEILIIGALVASIAELISFNINDNVSIPLFSGCSMYIVSMII